MADPVPGAKVDEPDDEDELARGRTLGRYVVLDRLGRGAMGSVYAAYDPELARRVALKVLRPGAAVRQGHAAAHERLLREARALAQLAHPNVVRVFDVGVDDGRVFLAMELVEGQSLRRWLELPRGWREVAEILEQAGRGLAAAHALGLVHRDFKPDNVLVAADGRVRVGDFGLVRRMDAEVDHAAGGEPAHDDAVAGSLRTAAGDVLGTPAYMAPEQHEGAEADPRCDQYAFCVTAYEALYGRRPFEGNDRGELLAAKRRGLAREPGARGGAGRVPASLRAVVRRGLSPAPADRFAAMEPLLAALGRARARAGTWRVVVVAGTVGLGAVGMAVARPGPGAPPCADAGAVAGVVAGAAWDEASRAAVRERLAEHRPRDAAEALMMGLDGWVEGWAAADRDACEDTWVRGEQSSVRLAARRECLRAQWLELEETASLLRAGDADVAAHGEALVAGLPSPAECERARPLAHAVAPEQAEARRRTRARAATLRRAGRLDAAWAELEAAGEGAGDPAHALARAEVLRARGEPEASEVELRRALHLARATADARAEAEAWRGLAALAREPERARFYAEMAAAALASRD